MLSDRIKKIHTNRPFFHRVAMKMRLLRASQQHDDHYDSLLGRLKAGCGRNNRIHKRASLYLGILGNDRFEMTVNLSRRLIEVCQKCFDMTVF